MSELGKGDRNYLIAAKVKPYSGLKFDSLAFYFIRQITPLLYGFESNCDKDLFARNHGNRLDRSILADNGGENNFAVLLGFRIGGINHARLRWPGYARQACVGRESVSRWARGRINRGRDRG